MPVDRLADVECPSCGQEITVLDDGPPENTKITICGSCGHLMLLNNDLQPVEMPDEIRETLENSEAVIEYRRRIVH